MWVGARHQEAFLAVMIPNNYSFGSDAIKGMAALSSCIVFGPAALSLQISDTDTILHTAGITSYHY